MTSYPGRAPGHRGRRRRRRRGRAGARRGRARRAASCCARPRSSTSTTASRSARARKSLALRLEFRAPDRTLTDEEVAGACASGSRRRSPRSEGRSVSERSAAQVIVAGASGFAGALAAELVWRHPRLELRRGDRAQRRRQARSTELYPALPGAARADRARPRRRVEEVDAAIVAYPHGAAAPVVAEMRGLGVLVVDLSADFRLRRLADLRALVRRARRARAARGRRLRADRARTASGSRDAELVANPGCYPTAALLALAPLAERGLIEDVVDRRQVGRLGRGPGRGRRLASSTSTENVSPYGGRRPPPRARDRPGAAALLGRRDRRRR